MGARDGGLTLLNAPSSIVRFAGPVSWVPGPGPGITLLGKLAGPEATPAQLSLIGSAAPTLPDSLQDLTVEAVAAAVVVLRSGPREWRVSCRTWQLHRDVGAQFYTAIPPRPTPWQRRLSWRVLLGLATTSPGRWLLARRVAKKSNHG